jgi:hypothetical protein
MIVKANTWNYTIEIWGSSYHASPIMPEPYTIGPYVMYGDQANHVLGFKICY